MSNLMEINIRLKLASHRYKYVLPLYLLYSALFYETLSSYSFAKVSGILNFHEIYFSITFLCAYMYEHSYISIIQNFHIL